MLDFSEFTFIICLYLCYMISEYVYGKSSTYNTYIKVLKYSRLIDIVAPSKGVNKYLIKSLVKLRTNLKYFKISQQTYTIINAYQTNEIANLLQLLVLI